MCCLLYVLQIGNHHASEEFAVRGKEPKDEVQIYTWKDATLRELTDLVRRNSLPAFLSAFYIYLFVFVQACINFFIEFSILEFIYRACC